MNSENKLFDINFIKKISTGNIDSVKKQNFIKKYEEINKNEKDKQKIETKNNRETDIVYRTSIHSIDSRLRDTTKYPFANDFEAPFGKVYNNISEIELVSSEIPNSDQVIRDLPLELKNNTMYWKNIQDFDLNYLTDITFDTKTPNTINLYITNHNLKNSPIEIIVYNSKLDIDLDITGVIDDIYLATIIDKDTLRIPYKNGIIGGGTTSVNLGQPVYQVDFKPGNYTSSTLTDQMETSFNQIKRSNDLGQYHYFVVSVNLDTDVITCDSVLTTQLAGNPVSTTAASEIITVFMFSHGLKTGDRVKMIDVKTVGGIQSNVLSGDFIITVLDMNTFTYEVNTRAIETISGGGNTVKVGKDAPFKFLLDTLNTKIQFKTGFADEDSSESINSINPFTTYIIKVQDLEIIGDYIRVTCDTPHGLDSATVLNISNIAIGYPCEITTSVPHKIKGTQIIRIRDSNSFPSVNGEYTAVYTGVYTFTIDASIKVLGNSGEVVYGGDRVLLGGIKTTPRITIPFFFVENGNIAVDQFDVKASIFDIDQNTISKTIVQTSQVFVNHPDHGFTNIDEIYSINSEFTYIHTSTRHSYSGSFESGVSVIDGPVMSNTLDILIVNHGLTTSDTITIVNSTSTPTIDGVYNVQFIDVDTLRISFVHSIFTPGTISFFSGDKINITNSDSLPKIDGYWYINNKFSITNIDSGVTTTDITLSNPVEWIIGDNITISNTNSQPSIDGDYTIYDIPSSNVITITLNEPVINSGSVGKITNKNSGAIYTNLTLTSPGISAILGKTQEIIHYRVEPKDGSGYIGGIPINDFNGTLRNIARIINKDNYMIRIENSYADSIVTAGGSSVKVSSDLHGYRSIQANTDDGTSSGKLFRSISLEGENYIYLVIPGLDSVSTTTTNITNVFAKILLDESPGLMCFNSFISVPKIFDPPKERLSSLKMKMIDYLGFGFNFNDLNYSLSLKITEKVEYIKNTNLLSKSSMKLVKD